MRREKAGEERRHRRRARPWLWTVLALLVLLGLGVWAARIEAPPVGRVALTGPPSPPTPRPLVVPDLAEFAAVARRAEIAAEEARLAALREARLRLEQELEALRQAAEDRPREAAPARPEAPRGAPPAIAAPPADIARRPVRIVVLHRANSAPAAAAALAVAETLRGGGVAVQALRAASFVPSTPVVRYFHEEDRLAAAWLAAQLGQGWAVQDFSGFQPLPAPQTLEVWLPAS